MLIKLPDFSVDPNQPFANDLLRRQGNAEMLTELVGSYTGPLVFSIDAPWGTGKTVFLHMWRAHLQNNGFMTLLFNAWENDFSKDAVVSLVGELSVGIEKMELNEKAKKAARKTIKRIARVGVALVKEAAPVAIKVATAGALDFEKFYKEAIANWAEQFAREQIRKYETAKMALVDFRKHLCTLVENISNGKSDNEVKPLIVIIDELDRCRPTYAIEILETAKHLFNVKGIIFVLAMDKDQICHSIRSVYGQGMAVDGYLKRFIDLEYVLPTPPKGIFCQALFSRFGLDDYFARRTGRDSHNDKDSFLRIFTELFHVFNFSLRFQEQCFAQLSIAMRITPRGERLHPILLGTLIALKADNLALYKKFIARIAPASEVLNYIRDHEGGTTFLEGYHGPLLEAYLVSCSARSFDENLLKSPYQSVLRNDNATEDEKRHAQVVLDYISSFRMYGDFQMLDYLVRKIDMISSFPT